jgi:hypothetical protein
LPTFCFRLGLAWGEEGKIYTSPLFNISWTLLTPEEINTHYNHIKTMFKDKPHGPFKALVEFVGETRAIEIARDGGQCIIQPGLLAAVTQRKDRKQKRGNIIDISD